MPILDILAEGNKVWQDPAWIMFALAGGVGLLTFAALFFIYPFTRD